MGTERKKNRMGMQGKKAMNEKGKTGVGEGKGRRWGKGSREGEGKRGRDLLDKCQTTCYAPVSDCMGRPITYSYGSYSTRTTMKRTNFARRFDKPDLNFQKFILVAKARHIQKS